jgi:hypothetical protein
VVIALNFGTRQGGEETGGEGSISISKQNYNGSLLLEANLAEKEIRLHGTETRISLVLRGCPGMSPAGTSGCTRLSPLYFFFIFVVKVNYSSFIYSLRADFRFLALGDIKGYVNSFSCSSCRLRILPSCFFTS